MTSTHDAAQTDRPVALVTAASRGMGRGIARELARRGWRLGLFSRSEDVVGLGEELGAHVCRGSTSDPDDLARFCQSSWEALGRIDAVVNNTGHPPRGGLLDVPDTAWHEALDLILLNVVRMSRLATPYLLRNPGGGAIVNMSSIAAVQPDLTHPVSSVLRAGLGGFAKLYAQQYARQGLRMNNLVAGRIESYPQPEERVREIPAQRLGTVEEVASYVAFLLSPEAAYVNGQNIVIDGGLVRGL